MLLSMWMSVGDFFGNLFWLVDFLLSILIGWFYAEARFLYKIRIYCQAQPSPTLAKLQLGWAELVLFPPNPAGHPHPPVKV